MSTTKKLADALGVTPNTIRSHKKSGFVVELNEAGGILIDESIKSFVKFQSEQIRILKSLQKSPKKKNGQSRQLKSEPKGIDEWKEEKEKQAAIKLRLQNDKDKGELIPSEALIELLNPVLSLFKSKTLNISNEAQKRHPFNPDQVRVLDNVSVYALEVLNERSTDELLSLISEVIKRHSKYHDTSEEVADHSMGD